VVALSFLEQNFYEILDCKPKLSQHDSVIRILSNENNTGSANMWILVFGQNVGQFSIVKVENVKCP